MIHRPQGRAAAVKSVRVEDSDAGAGAFTFTFNPKTQTRAPLPAYRGPADSFKATVMAIGRAKAAAGVR